MARPPDGQGAGCIDSYGSLPSLGEWIETVKPLSAWVSFAVTPFK